MSRVLGNKRVHLLEASASTLAVPWVQVHTHASYEYCDEGDAFRTASYLANMKQPGAGQQCWV